MSSTTAEPTVRRSRPALTLALAPVPFVVLVVTVLTTSAASGVADIADLTPAMMAGIRPQWIGLWIVYSIALIFGSIGMYRVFRPLPGLLARTVPAATVLSVVCILASSALYLSLTGFSADRLGSLTRYDVALEVNLVSFWLAWVALVCGGIALRRIGVLGRSGLVIAVLAAVLGILDVAGHGAVPPFVVSFLWLALGISLLKFRGVPS
jgi:hypothetical protein